MLLYKADLARDSITYCVSCICMYGANSTDESGCTVTETLGKSVDRVCKAIMGNISYSLQPSPVFIPLLLLCMADAMLLAEGQVSALVLAYSLDPK